ncbi:mutator-like element transposase [Trichoderma arundinaceum]|uniref:Mutator-like element transposase n=1 Tax=Trichoderma arundinaceum TaxID=490622 RepID=A0A395NF29_TRIAR|nr:mutator-like element transposase [Trichoderma arundinaceum]
MTWSLHHRPDTKHAKHNHEPSHHPSAHPTHRRLDDSSKATLSELVSAGVSPRDIQTYLRRQNPQSLATRRVVYNYISKVKDDMHEGQSSIHALINQLDREGFWSRVRVDENQRVTAILFAHPGSLRYLQAYSDLLLLDCTYKTNEYQMPLLDMIGVDACQQSFCTAFAFLSGEQEEDYVWAVERLRSLYEACDAKLPSVVLSDRCLACLNAIGAVFPSAHSLPCLWHANRAVLAHCLPNFSFQERLAAGIAADASTRRGNQSAGWAEFYSFWHSIMQSPTEAEFNRRVAAFEEKYLPDHAEEVAYIQRTWLQPYKEKLVKAWVDEYMHFGNTVTSRVEGIHALLKSYLKTSKFNLFDVWRAIKHAVENQLSEIQSKQARQQTRKPTTHANSGLFNALHGWIPHEAIKKVEEQRKLLEKTDPPVSLVCSGTFTKAFGLPCVHKIKSLLDRKQGFRIDDFHKQWHLRRNLRQHLILEPIGVESSIRKSPNTALSSTQREPSALEQLQRQAPTCSRCHAVGHSRSSKTCPLMRQEILLESSAPRLVDSTTTDMALAGWSQDVERTLTSQISDTSRNVTQDNTPEAMQCSIQQRDEDRIEDTIVVQSLPPGPRQTKSRVQATAPKVNVSVQPPTRLQSVTSTAPHVSSTLPYYAPGSIYSRYVAARLTWYKSQPKGYLKTNQADRRAMGLPQRYQKEMFVWYQDYKQMGEWCILPQGGRRKWTKEEMMAYIDWDTAEAERTEAQVKLRMENDPNEATRRGMRGIWRGSEEDEQAQARLFS